MACLASVLFSTGATVSAHDDALQPGTAAVAAPNLAVKNNLAMTALLLDAQELNSHQLAREVYQQDPTNAAYISTYAFSLHLQKKDAEALKVMEGLTPWELQDPTIAGYYSLILEATGNKEKVRRYMDLAFKCPMLKNDN